MNKDRKALSLKLVTQGEKIAMVPVGEPVPLSISSKDDIASHVAVVARFLKCGSVVQVFFEDSRLDNGEDGLALVSREAYQRSAQDKFEGYLRQFRGLGPVETEWTGPQVLEIRLKDMPIRTEPENVGPKD